MKIYLVFMVLISGLLKGSAKFWFANDGDLAVNDMSKICVDGLQHSIFLTYGMGIADAIAITITNHHIVRNCSFVFHEDIFDNQIVRIIVIQLLNKPRALCEGTNLYLTDSSSNDIINICERFTEKYLEPFVYVTHSTVQFTIEDLNNTRFQYMKITASSSKKIETSETCSTISEIRCIFNKSCTCISRELQCDENINCGRYNSYDEDQRLCKKNKNKKAWLTIFVGPFLSFFVLYSIAHRTRRCLPLCKLNFIKGNEKETDIITLKKYLPISKTYIPMHEAEASQERTSSETIQLCENSDVFMQKIYYQRQKKKFQLKNHIKRNLTEACVTI